MQDSGLSILFMGSNFLRLLQGLWVTLQLSLISVAVSLPLGIAFGMFMTLKHPAARIISRLILDFVRIMPQLVLLFILYFGVAHAFGWNLSAYASAVAMLVIWGTAEMGDLVRGALISIPRHQYESAAALGMTGRQTFLEVILPQTVQRLLPPAINLVTRMIKTTSIVVLIGIVEVLKTGQQIIDANRLQFPSAALWIYGVIFFLYFLVCWPVSLLAKRLERRMN
ncbi:MAG: amino acid ABC transporter permease [Butyrivibrio sp.]|jgi:polar amino acid transport system permease protein|nr:amino acid ABC transporter permease [Butyrivibrio sp.]